MPGGKANPHPTRGENLRDSDEHRGAIVVFEGAIE
jgi:hypothetical protein